MSNRREDSIRSRGTFIVHRSSRRLYAYPGIVRLDAAFSVRRLRGVRVPGPVHDGDVHKGVRARPPHILRVELQPFRLRGHLGIDLRSDLVRVEVRLFRPLRPTRP